MAATDQFLPAQATGEEFVGQQPQGASRPRGQLAGQQLQGASQLQGESIAKRPQQFGGQQPTQFASSAPSGIQTGRQQVAQSTGLEASDWTPVKPVGEQTQFEQPVSRQAGQQQTQPIAQQSRARVPQTQFQQIPRQFGQQFAGPSGFEGATQFADTVGRATGVEQGRTGFGVAGRAGYEATGGVQGVPAPQQFGQQRPGQQQGWQSVAGQRAGSHPIEMADTTVLADVLASRLGLTSQDLAQAIPQLGAALSGRESQPGTRTGLQSPVQQAPIGQHTGLGQLAPVGEQTGGKQAVAGLQAPTEQQFRSGQRAVTGQGAATSGRAPTAQRAPIEQRPSVGQQFPRP